MDILTSVEPQLAIPVVGVVLCALLVYIFGFQKTQEPSFQHLAVLQATSKGSRGGSSNGLRQRSATPKVTGTPGKTKEKPVVSTLSTSQAQQVTSVSGGQEKASPKPNGVVKTGASAKVSKDGSNKENVRPQKSTPKKEKVPREAAEDLEAGDWIQAPSRKDKKNKTEKTKKEKPSPSGTKDGNTNSAPAATSGSDEDWDFPVLKDVNALNVLIQQQKELQAKAAESTSQEEVAPVEAPAPAKPESAGKAKKATPASVPSSVESSPKKSNAKTSNNTKVKEEVVKVEPAVEAEVKKVAAVSKENASPVKAAKKPEVAPAASAAEDQSSVNDPRNNIAFDEMGDTWEEAKSRGTKKRRARKD